MPSPQISCNHSFPRRISALLSALALCAVSGVAGAQALSPGTNTGTMPGGTARSGPALAATPQPATPPTTPPTPAAATPLPGQSALPSQLPPLNANGIGGQPATTAFPPGSVPSRTATA